ncbi:hypothetical protein [uncultured Flavobacterium sp.]|uniref:hypothetical protein n=1 Tax=uncultured Flavobacterium sp. TaxID=165435 RepID=UPI003081FCE6
MESKNTKEQDDVAVIKNANSNFQFRTPAGIQDFQGDSAKQTALNNLWSSNLDEFTQQGMLSNPWNSSNTPPTTNYYNPVQNNPQSSYSPVNWLAFPGRLAFNFPNASQDQLNQMADTGNIQGLISSSPCDSSNTTTIPYFPYGPRGWQDEYCEWAVTRNSDNKIIRIDFTCENPEYWNSLWLIDPNKVVTLYQSILNKPQITLEDLSLPGAVNPITGQPIYNPLNKWNSGPVSSDTLGGAIHLTSTPNTLQTEIGLATAATVQRNNPSGSTGNTAWPSRSFNTLLCDAQYGQKNRNSDPTIGGNVNNLVTGPPATQKPSQVVTLANPPGLYIQMPSFGGYSTPDGTDASTFWNIVRGSKTLNDEYGTQMPGNFILHAVFEVPADKNYTISDIKISGENIAWASQVASTFKMQIVASSYDSPTTPQGYDAVGTPSTLFAQPLQLFYQDYFNAMYNTSVPNPVNNPISLLSNSTFIPPTIFNSANGASMVLICDTCTAVNNDPSTYPDVTFDDPNIIAVVNSVQTGISYAVPGNSLPSTYTALFITISVGVNAAAGPHGVFITNVGQNQSTAMPAMFTVLPTTIQANIKWQNTGVIIPSGTTVNIAYQSGLWTANPDDNNGQLYNANGNPYFIAGQPGYTMPGQNEGALIGKVGDTVFLVGMGATVPANLQGELQLCINDDLNAIYGAGFADNIGSISVKITIG